MKKISESSKKLLKSALEEDIGDGDVTCETIIPSSCQMEGEILGKENGILAGLPWALEVFKLLDASLSFEIYQKDGSFVSKGALICKISGSGQAILKGERVALNILMHASGIATLTKKFVNKAKPLGIGIFDTRKTFPLWRELEKYSVRMGGGNNHRMGLFDQVMVKENHILVAGSISKALGLVRKNLKKELPLEVEVENLDQLEEVLPLAPDIVLLDNMSPSLIREALKKTSQYPLVKIEISGGITLENLDNYLIQGVHRIAIGALTHSAKALDVSLNLWENEK